MLCLRELHGALIHTLNRVLFHGEQVRALSANELKAQLQQKTEAV